MYYGKYMLELDMVIVSIVIIAIVIVVNIDGYGDYSYCLYGD